MFPDIFQKPGAAFFEEKVKLKVQWATLWIQRRKERPGLKLHEETNKLKSMLIYEAFNKLSNTQLELWTDIQKKTKLNSPI